MTWKVKNRVDIFKNPFITLTEKQSSNLKFGEHNFYCIDFPNWVNIVPITSDNKLILVKQYRHGLEEYTLETPGGVVDPGESPISTARRELLEETGYEGDFVSLGKVAANPAIQNNYCHIYLVKNCMKTSNQNLDDTEDIEVVLVDMDYLNNYIETEKIVHSLSVVSILKALNYLKK
ncbi:NUDIX hydrolase [Alkalicella caledoniensis]|uniref:NUDIX hydrolase n=1 Tax=Alkalicella caledoniensis TaxID=2731377 RepID=A0A7G9WC41_ALKCA|nr:NUDIX hydrolase [Alkalicella caledoniensis]QNO16253.1 NUDIX hydrolase [Alkalicella caledoniensis]